MPHATEVVLAFVENINRHDVDKLCRMMTEDHEFVDSLGAVVRGKDAMRMAWTAYFFLIPDYAIDIDDVVAKGETVALFGTACGTCAVDGQLLPENRWRIPLALRGSVRDGRVARWQVFADNEPVRQIIAAGH